jgi:hypothetical protein
MGARKDGIYEVDDAGGGGTSVNITDGIDPLIKATVFDRPNSNPLAVELVDINGDPLSGSAVSIADGADVTQGAIADAAVITDTTGTISGKLRGLIKWAFERMPASLGQKIMTASFPVVISSDQSAVPISAASLPLPTGASTSALQTQPGIDIGDVTVNNAAGASAVNIQDGGNTITVDGTVITSPPANASTNLAQVGGVAIAEGQTTMSASIPVVIASDQSALKEKWDTGIASSVTNWTFSTALNSTIDVLCTGQGLVQFRFVHAGPSNGVIQFEGSIDGGTNYDIITVQAGNTTATTPNQIRVVSAILVGFIFGTYSAYAKVEAYTNIRIKLTTVFAVGETLSIQTIVSALPTTKGEPAGINIYGRVNPTISNSIGMLPVYTTGTIPNALFTALQDSTTNTGAKVVAASTLPATTDTALVVSLRDAVSALVSDARESYISGATQPLSLTSDGRLRVSSSPADTDLDFFGGFNPYGDADDFGISSDNPYEAPFPLGQG